jgi:sugar lactone lactonase YvrE
MKNIESLISPLIENQFPSFYKEEGPQFIAFVKAYYEWLETANNVLYHTRKLPEYRDIDTTLDEFIIEFKEKYLKNIQFDTATNKQLLVKNSLDLYRSKGTERSIDLFFKLVYGTAAEVRYPADNILRVSDGIWERPQYLEVTHSRYNIDYVGKQIIGALSGARAFVEKFIRRRTSAGYVDLLYISNLEGAFRNGELIGLNINNTPVFDRLKRAQLLGSIRRVILQDRGRDFRVGDLVTFEGSTNGEDGIARVESVSEATGVIDFIFIDGGYGYTLDADSIISEKVITLQGVTTTSGGPYFRLFDESIEPIISLEFTSATADLAVGNTVFRYTGGGAVVGAGKIISLTQTGANGTATISHVNGVFTNTATYYTTANAISFYGNTAQDATITGTVMGIPQTYSISISSQSGTLAVGQTVLYKNTSAVIGTGIIENITAIDAGNTLTINTATGSFQVGQRLEVLGNSSISANVSQVDLTVGVYNIRKSVSTLKYSGANNNLMPESKRIYRYNTTGQKVAEGLLLTVSHDSGTSTGNLTFVPISGYFIETERFYTDTNTSFATTVTYTSNVTGGDYTPSSFARIFTQTTNTSATPVATSFGSGAQFNVGTLGDTETIFIGTDLLASNSVGTADYDRVTLTVASSTGFAAGDRVYQTINRIAFNANSSVNAATGFITLPTANSKFTIGDIVGYRVDAGNTAINGLANNNYYYVAASNATGVILAYPSTKTTQISNSTYTTFANNQVNETGHYLYKLVHGTVFETAAGVVRTKDNHNVFSVTGGVVSTTVYANSNLIEYGLDTTNTAINTVTAYQTISQANQVYMSLPITAAAYGFPKNPQGDSKNTIYSCLTFDQFTIGTIGSLSGVDPGSEYNIDPYVLAYQPYISAFGRKDFIINIQNATGVYVVGEKVNQVLPNLVYYDVKVDNGVYANSYSEKSFVVNTKDDIQSGNDFILYTSNSITFNSTDDVNSNADFIALANATFYYPTNTYVRYYTNASNTALTGLSNNAFYYIATANDTGVTLSSTPGGSNVSINALANSATFNSNTSVITATDFISITSANTLFANGQQVRYITTSIAVTGLSNNELYYVRYANTSGLALSSTSGGANVDITGLNPGDSNHTLRYYNPNFNGHNLVKYASEFANNQRILYRVPTSNTVISGLANNTAYYVVGANTVGFQVSATRGGANINITAAGTGESHNFSTVAGFLPGDFVYQSTTPVMNASIQSIFSNTTGDYVRVSGNTQEINVTSSNTLLSYTNPYVTANVSSATLFQIISSAKGIIKSANTTVARIKRLSFENTFVSGSLLIGDVSGVSANVIGVAEDSDVLYPIGLNASIEANVITATGQITSLQVIDSGVGYSNGDIVQYTSEDGARSGSIKIINDGNGIGKGYYKSSKGFLSEDMYVHDGDYYQEYSYEILSKISVDRYSDMFKKVMHTAGTKFFGSALIVEEANVALSLTEISTGQEIQFNSNSSINSTNETINTGALNPFANGDLVMYTTSNTVVEANVSVTFNSNTGVSNGFISIVDNVIPSGHRVKYIPTSYDNLIGGIATSFNSNTAVSNGVITLTNNIYENGDAVNYYVSTGNTAVPGLQNAQTYYVSSSSGNNITLSLSPDYVYTDLTNTSLVQVGSYSTLIESLPELNPTGVFFKPDGARMYIIGSNKDVIREYNLSTPWSVNTATFVAQTTFPTSVAGWGETAPTGLYISSDGVYIYAVGSTIDRIQQLTMSTPWSVNTAALGASFDANAAIFAITGVNAGITGVTFKPEGDKVYVVDSDNDRIYQFNLSVPWDISTATLYGNTSSSSSPGIGDSSARGLYFIPDGKKCYTVGNVSDRISTINLSTAWDITTAASASSVNQFFVFDPPNSGNTLFSPNDIFIKPDLSRMYITEAGNSAGSTAKVIEYNWYTTVPSSISETGHNLVKQYYYTSEANTSGFKLKAQYNVAPLSLNAITASETQTIKIYELQNNFSYYIVGTASNTIKLSLTPSGSPINITANGTHSGAATAGHYLTKTVEE